ncbi:acyloxyacyl hydrolase [Hyphococcus sp.]|jgi:lipid A 3-O-deacylase|uniref:acyloxyacyl hydrolase n=1 Tax=Hyphococcus sp. TaxID=2038636 RepID=UPI003D0C6DC4
MRLIAAIAILFAMSGAAYAGPVEEVRAGVYAQSCCGFGSSKEDGVAINGEAVFASPRFLSVLAKPRPVIGATLAPHDGATDQVYAGLEWKVDISRWFVAAGVGGVVHNGETDRYDPIADAARVDETVFFGCRALFRLAGDVGYRVTERVSASFHWNHISNAGLCSENEGLDQMGLRVGLSL